MLFAICIVSMLTGWAKDIMAIYSSFFPGIGATATGSIIAAIYGVVLGAIFGYVIGVLYNYFDKRIKTG
jgi:tetrahydromethanopterin S-methyltransferase subunit C